MIVKTFYHSHAPAWERYIFTLSRLKWVAPNPATEVTKTVGAYCIRPYASSLQHYRSQENDASKLNLT